MSKNTCAGMKDISDKSVTLRRAVAEGTIVLTAKAYQTLIKHGSPKGDVFETARIAGIMAAKSTPSIIPLCHPLPLEKVTVTFNKLSAKRCIHVTAEVVCSGKTGVEMEALAAVSASCLTIYDMSKWMGQDMTISNVRLIHKSGGKSGDFDR
jgi:cyclic pyranopterin phosphate synthase